MGDRTTPMKFGPEWLRNLSREPTSRGSSGASGGNPSAPPIRPVTSIATASSNTTTPPNTSKVLLAKLRYGREEMLALYDRQTAEAPPQLRSSELLYQPRGKPPYALNNNFEDDTRDSNMRNNPPSVVVLSPSDRYRQGRGRGMTDGRGRAITPISDSRGKARGFVRQTSLGRSPNWHNGQRTYPGTPDDDTISARALWNNGNGMNPLGVRPNVELPEWANKAPFRKNRQNHTNWRQQPNREEGEEWRSAEGARRGQEKWEREWPERSNQEKPWTRRQWSGDNNDDSLPEWAVENSDAYGGTFDSSGAFHGYSNDDSNLPKSQDAPYPLARSHTHGSFVRSRPAEEGSEEWWASEKAKKLSAKRFDATEVKFKKHATPGISEENPVGITSTPPADAGANTNTGPSTITGQTVKPKIELLRRSASPPTHPYEQELQDEAAALPIKREPEPKHEDEQTKDRTYFSDNTQSSVQLRIDMLLRTEETDSTNESGNYKSVMMTPSNNHLRQKHQNIGMPTNEPPKRVAAPLFERAKQAMQNQSEEENQQKQQETKLVEDLLDMNLNDELQTQLLNATTQAAGAANQMPSPRTQLRMNLLNQDMAMNQPNSNMPMSPGVPQGSMMRPMGITNSMLNASLGLPLTGSNMGMPPMTSMTPSNSNPSMLSSGLQGLGGNNMQNTMHGGMQTAMPQRGMQMQSSMQGMQGNGFQPVGAMPSNMQPGAITNTNLQSVSGMPGFQGMGNSLFMQPPSTNIQNPSDMAMHGQQGMYPMHGHGLQQSTSHGSFNPASMYGNMMQPPPCRPLPNIPLTDQWYYEDPKKTIQGPFTSKEMCSWYLAGFFNPDLMVRRACESGLRPLVSYGMMPFGPMAMIPLPYNQLGGRFDMRQVNENLMNAQQAGLGPEVESLWSQPTASDMMWMQQAAQARDDNNRVNNLSMFYWDQSSGMSNSLLPEGIAKDMKTEDEILAQMRASQSDPASQKLTFMSDAVSPEDAFTAGTNIAPNLEELQKLIESDVHVSAPQRSAAAVVADASALQHAHLVAADTAADKEKTTKPTDDTEILEVTAKQQAPTKAETKPETKPIKQAIKEPVKEPVKVEDKPAKAKEVVAVTKTKVKKQKEEKREDTAEIITTTEEKKATEKRSEEPSPPKNKKEDKANKKDLEKEKKEWLKDGFTIVKGAEKKDNKKKEREEARASEEAEKKKKDEEKRALIEAEKNRAPEPVTRKQQMEIGQVRQPQTQPPPQPEPAPKKAPWSAPAAGRDGLALSDIQRLEREKKLEQMKEQQHMMQVIAQQQAAAAIVLKEQQELQASQVGWAKKKHPNNSPPGQTLAEIQAEARLQASSVAAAATAAAREEARVTPPPVNITPWGSTNGAGFWDSPPPTKCVGATEPKAADAAARASDTKPKKRVTVVAPPKKETTPAADFESWCTSVLSNWRDAASIDIPTFIAFLRDIESPYEVKDYVKCYLGDTKESTDFSRQFLERRSRLLRVGMVTPSDDLCSPAAAINPRTNSGSDYTEVKSKGKKTKKNKMFKVDARILGFSVTASEDRINIGDIDMV